MIMKQYVSTADVAIRLLTPVASSNQNVTQMSLNDPSVEEVLCYALREEIRATAKPVLYSGVYRYLFSRCHAD